VMLRSELTSAMASVPEETSSGCGKLCGAGSGCSLSVRPLGDSFSSIQSLRHIEVKPLHPIEWRRSRLKADRLLAEFRLLLIASSALLRHH
jgi:hypothetical protein